MRDKVNRKCEIVSQQDVKTCYLPYLSCDYFTIFVCITLCFALSHAKCSKYRVELLFASGWWNRETKSEQPIYWNNNAMNYRNELKTADVTAYHNENLIRVSGLWKCIFNWCVYVYGCLCFLQHNESWCLWSVSRLKLSRPVIFS